MFKEPFNFALQRTPLQAFGWYLVFLVIALLVGAIAGGVASVIHPAPNAAASYQAGVAVGRYIGPIVPTLVGIAVLIPRKLSASNVLLALLAVLVGIFAGWIGAGFILAFLTTRPPRMASTENVLP